MNEDLIIIVKKKEDIEKFKGDFEGGIIQGNKLIPFKKLKFIVEEK